MKKQILRSVLIVGTTITLLSFDLPKGWTSGGTDLTEYEMGIDKGAGQDGKNAATLKSIKKGKDFGTMFQNCLPDKFIGKRVRMTAFVKTKDVEGWAGLWFRIDGEGSKDFLGFDNMKDGKKDRSIKGTTDWTKYEIVLDVPPKSTNLAFGALLAGKGQIWFDKFNFEVVDNTVPTTGSGKDEYMPNKEPVNLDFDN
ncbi:MAG: hypothetical protein WCI04_04770 [archaeon]